MQIQKGMFVELEYEGKLADSGEIFDLTSADVAKERGIFNERAFYGPRIICVGERQVVLGLDQFLIGKEEKQEYDVHLEPEQAFGKKDPKLLKIVPAQVFLKERIRPVVGLRVTVNGMLGTIKTVSGGRVIVDFNHPLSGHPVSYHVKILRHVTTTGEKTAAIVGGLFGRGVQHKVDGDACTIFLPIPAEMQDSFATEIKRVIPELKKVVFTAPASQTEKSAKSKHHENQEAVP